MRRGGRKARGEEDAGRHERDGNWTDSHQILAVDRNGRVIFLVYVCVRISFFFVPWLFDARLVVSCRPSSCLGSNRLLLSGRGFPLLFGERL